MKSTGKKYSNVVEMVRDIDGDNEFADELQRQINERHRLETMELRHDLQAMVVALESWVDWALGHPDNKSDDPLEAVLVENPRSGRFMCNVCCMSASVSQEDAPRKHPWHYDDCPVFLTVEALSRPRATPGE